MVSTVKASQNWTNIADFLKHLASKVGSSITMKFERSVTGKDNLFQKDLSHRRGISLSAREDFSPVWKTHRPRLRHIYIH